MQQPEMRQRMSDGMKALWRDPVRSAKAKAAMRVAALDRDLPSMERRFWTYVSSPTRGWCLLWTGKKNEFYDREVHRSVHPARWIYERTIGSIPPGKHLKPTCGKARCVNIQHLVLV